MGQTLAAQAGTWTGTVKSFSYQWQRCATAGAACTTIAGAAGPSYVITPDEIGFTVRLVVTALGVTAAGSATSAPTAVVAGAPVPVPATGTTVAVTFSGVLPDGIKDGSQVVMGGTLSGGKFVATSVALEAGQK